MRALRSLTSLNTWVLILSLSAVCGIALIGIGAAANLPVLVRTGIGLVLPLLAGACVLVLLVIPLLAIHRSRRKSQSGELSRSASHRESS